eukprot:TRINITY_DN22500_c0_g1_i3.p1 TRINITY_DN22500_c0_g1~~TRINITY_DN22500_c0_g1_i3.p1  ORF type:complete len:205 (-),score=54.02 TRINITY_DN22500_c0_g1_i3:28-642(-)
MLRSLVGSEMCIRDRWRTMGCGGSKEEAKSPRSADHDDDPHDSPPASPSMQDIEGLDGDSTTKKLGSSDPRHDPELRRFPDRDASSIRAGASGKSRLHKGGTMVLVTSYRLTSENEMSKLESKCPEFAASWEYRKRRVVKEVIDIQPDVLCLQGVSDFAWFESCLLYTSDAADEEDSVDLGGRRIIKKKKKEEYSDRKRDRIKR